MKRPHFLPVLRLDTLAMAAAVPGAGTTGVDPLAQTRRELKAYYLGDIPAPERAGHFAKEAGRHV
ncbi:MAG: hypothetical protein LBR27_06740 [Bifidobacteriaceae bacterium]|nr:hypothetical protein [Bifidobacteriaceae bacterium]